MSTQLPVLVLVGRPNVGKSTLFNRLTGTRDALVSDLPGLTRDRQIGFARHGDRRFIVVDTGGLAPQAGDPLAKLAEEQAQLALDDADEIALLVDLRAGLTPADESIARDLRKRGKRIRVLANKAEGLPDSTAADLFGLGLGEPHLISAEHGQGVEAFLDRVLEPYPPAADDVLSPDGATRIAVIGRPNVGKSTLVNRLVGEERVLAGERPGTTRDAIAVPFEYRGKNYVLVDTAGIRRRARVEAHVEKLSIVKALQAVESADVVIAVVDAQADIGVHDARLMGLVATRGKGMVLAVNKWDGLDEAGRARVRETVDYRLPFLDFVPVHFISAKQGSGLGELMTGVQAVRDATRQELRTPLLTRALERFVARNAPPAVVGRRIKLRYAHAGGRDPLTIVVHGNQTSRLPGSYKRYLANEFRKEFSLVGIPLKMEFRTGENPYKGKRR